MTTLSALARGGEQGVVVLTAVNALIQKLPPREVVAGMSFAAKAGQVVDSEKLIAWAAGNGYLRVPTVRETGEFAVRGGLVDLYPAGLDAPLRFDFFGRQLETIRTFDAETQRTTGNLKSVALAPMSEVLLNEDSIRRFRANYTATFGGNTAGDPLYAAVSAGQRFPGVEHWLPFFYEEMQRLADYVGDAPFVFDEQVRAAYTDRQTQVRDYYQAREQARSTSNATTGGRALQADRARSCFTTSAARPMRQPRARWCSSRRSCRRTPASRSSKPGDALAHNFAAACAAGDRRQSVRERSLASCSRSAKRGERPSSPAGQKARAIAWRRC